MSEKRRIRAEFQPMESQIVDLSPPGELSVSVIDSDTAMKVGISPAAYRGISGKSPKIGEDGCWMTYDDEKGEWVNTGVSAGGSCGCGGYDGVDGGDAPGAETNERIIDGGTASGNK